MRGYCIPILNKTIIKFALASPFRVYITNIKLHFTGYGSVNYIPDVVSMTNDMTT